MKKFLIIAVLFLFLSGDYAHAQTQPTQAASQFCTGGKCTYVPLEPLPYLPNQYGPENSFASLMPGIFQLLIGAGAVIAVVMIVLGALTYMFSDIMGNKKKALDRIRGAMWAIVLLVSSYLILVTINPDLVKFNLTLGTGVTAPSPTPSDGNTRVIIQNAGSTKIYNGSEAYEKILNLNEQCQSPKSLHPTGDGSDSGGAYALWECRQ